MLFLHFDFVFIKYKGYLVSGQPFWCYQLTGRSDSQWRWCWCYSPWYWTQYFSVLVCVYWELLFLNFPGERGRTAAGSGKWKHFDPETKDENIEYYMKYVTLLFLLLLLLFSALLVEGRRICEHTCIDFYTKKYTNYIKS